MSDPPPDLGIETRQQLLYLLSEAAELEHHLCCGYLFAAFSLRTRDDEGLAPDELAAARRWQATLYEIATQEMLHLALACNLLTAVGGAPHVRRPNLPQRTTHYPPEIQLALTRFDAATLQHFVYVERPEGADESEAEPFRPDHLPAQPTVETEMVPQPQEYVTVNQLYRGIEDGLRQLAERLGEEGLFIGPRWAQADPEQIGLPDMRAVTNLASAVAAIELIITQGEGGRGGQEESHYARFCAMQAELAELLERRPSLDPARPVLPNPFTREPSDAVDVSLVTDPLAVQVCDLFNGTYEAMLQLLARYLAHGEESDAELASLWETAVGLMGGVLRPVGELLTTLPAGDAHPGLTAGPSFHVYRSVHLLPHRRAAWGVLGERLDELATAAEGLVEAQPALAPARAALADAAARLR